MTYYIVLATTAAIAIANAVDTSDLLVTTDPVHDDMGRIIGYRKFAQL